MSVTTMTPLLSAQDSQRGQAEGMLFQECFGDAVSDHLPQVFQVIAGDEVIEVLSWNIMLRGTSG